LSERLDWLRLARTEAVGAATFAWLLGHFGTAADALDALPEMAKRGGRSGPLKIVTRDEAARELAAGEAIGARLILGCEAGFPRLLAVLDAPPPLIWVIGDPMLLARRTVAIVGARSASTAGRRFAGVLAAELGAMGFVVVSGLARGIDAAAHRGSLATGTAAVLAGGVDDIYPPENADLADAVRLKGCIVSERPPGFRARAQDFPRRNRIISGLSLGLPDHGAAGWRAGPRRLRRARLADRSARPRLQQPAAAGRGAGRRSRRRPPRARRRPRRRRTAVCL